MSTEIADVIAKHLDQAGWELHRRGRRGGLTTGEWTLLRYLATADPEAATPKEFEYVHAVDPRRVVEFATSLENGGYIRRIPLEHDKRTFRMEIAADGHDRMRRDPLLKLAGAISGRFEATEIGEVAITLVKLLHAFVDAGFRASAEDKRRGLANLEKYVESEVQSEGADEEEDQGVLPEIAGETAKPARAVAELLMEATGDVYKGGNTEELGRNHWFCLRYFQASGREAPMIATLMRDTGVNLKIASDTTHALERMGLLKREPSQTQHGGFAVSVTAKGRRLMEKDPLKKLGSVLAASLAAKELQQVQDLLDCVLEAGVAKIKNR